MDEIVSLAKRRGFVFPSSEIYGGLGSTLRDYGPLGVELKNNVKNAWWRSMVRSVTTSSAWTRRSSCTPRCGGLGPRDGSSATRWWTAEPCQRASAPTTWRARAAHEPSSTRATAPTAAHRGPRVQPHVPDPRGPGERTRSVVYLRPETAQGIFINFKNVLSSSRKKPPFGIAQIGKSFRNEITPGNFVFRTREFEQMEMEFFVPPGEADEWYEEWLPARRTGTSTSASRPSTCAPRARRGRAVPLLQGTIDVEYRFPFGWTELEGVANRGDFDLQPRQEQSARTSSTSTPRPTSTSCPG